MEQGRSIVWNQILSLLSPVDALRVEDPTLADALVRVSMTLEHASTGGSAIQWLPMHSPNELSMEEAAQQHRRLPEEWE